MLFHRCNRQNGDPFAGIAGEMGGGHFIPKAGREHVSSSLWQWLLLLPEIPAG